MIITKALSAQDETLDRTKPPAAGPPKDVHFPEYFDTTLSNGINLLVIENHKIPAVSIRLVFKNAGSYYDGQKYGLASLTAELLTKGTKNRTATQIAEDIDFLGASLTSGSDWDGSYVSLSVLKKFLGQAADVLNDVVMNPVFDEEEISRVKEQRISSIIQSKDDPGTLSDRMFNRVVFGNSPYAYPSEGTEQSIGKMTRDDLTGFYRANYSPSNLILAFVGDINREEAVTIINEKFGTWENRDFNTDELKSDNLPEDNGEFSNGFVYIVDKPEAVQSNIKVGHIGIKRNNPDLIPVSVMNTILGGYFGSRINFILREKYGYTYGAWSSFSSRIRPGDFSVEVSVRNDVTDSSYKLIIDELKRITSEEVSDEELMTAKNYMMGIFPLQLETANAVATRVINLKLYDLPEDFYSTYISNISKLTRQDIFEAAKKYIHPEYIYLVLAGNSKDVSHKMEKFGTVRTFDVDGKEVEKSNK